jgi:hypothetical protein
VQSLEKDLEKHAIDYLQPTLDENDRPLLFSCPWRLFLAAAAGTWIMKPRRHAATD